MYSEIYAPMSVPSKTANKDPTYSVADMSGSITRGMHIEESGFATSAIKHFPPLSSFVNISPKSTNALCLPVTILL
jgi:hypothetical protein